MTLFLKLLGRLRYMLANHSHSEDDKLLGFVTAMALGFYGVGCIVSCMALLIFAYSAASPQYHWYRAAIWMLGGGFYLMGQWLLLLTFVIRLDVTFKGVPFIRFHPMAIRACYVAVTLLLPLMIGIFVTIGLKQRTNAIIVAAVWVGITFVASMAMMVLFLVKVFQVMGFKAVSELDDKIGDLDLTSNITVKLVDVKSATRYALLVSVATATSLATLGIMVIITMYHEEDKFDNDQELGALEYSFGLSLTHFVNVSCRFLSSL